MHKDRNMKTSFLTSIIQKYYPATAAKIQTLIESNVLLEKLATTAYNKLELAIQKYADIAERLKVITRMVQAWRNKAYTDFSYTTVFISVAILAYFISPVDLLPDFIPFIGGLDDVLLLAYLIKIIDKEIEKFVAWENSVHIVQTAS